MQTHDVWSYLEPKLRCAVICSLQYNYINFHQLIFVVKTKENQRISRKFDSLIMFQIQKKQRTNFNKRHLVRYWFTDTVTSLHQFFLLIGSEMWLYIHQYLVYLIDLFNQKKADTTRINIFWPIALAVLCNFFLQRSLPS